MSTDLEKSKDVEIEDTKKESGQRQENNAEKRAEEEVQSEVEKFQSTDLAKAERKYEAGKPRNRFSVTNPLPSGFFETLKQAQALAKKTAEKHESSAKSCISGNVETAPIGRSLSALELPTKGESEKEIEHAGETVGINDKTTLSGELRSPDGKQVIRVANGKCSDSAGNLVGQLDEVGHFKNVKTQSVSDVNSQFDGWTFQGTENGNARQFTCDRTMSSGKMFLEFSPQEKLTCDVHMGMVIDRKTNRQIGILSAPKETGEHTGERKLSGGTFTFLQTPPLTVALADLTNCSFDLELNGQTGVHSRRLQGVCIGPEKLADGRPAPSKGGLFNTQDAIEVLRKHKNDVDKEISNTSDTNELNKQCDELADTEDRLATLQKSLETGDLTNFDNAKSGFEKLNKEADPLLAARQKADSKEEHLETLPTDTSKLNGEVKFFAAQNDASRTPKLETHKVKDGYILGNDDKPLFKITNENGQMVLAKTGSNECIPAHRLSGAVWNMMNFENGENIQWISHGDRFLSKADLDRRALNSLEYAQAVEKKTGSEDAVKRLNDTASAHAEYRENLERIFLNGPTQKNDLQWLAAGPTEVHQKATVRNDLPQSAVDARSQRRIDTPIFVAAKDSVEAGTNTFHISDIKSGELRLGNELYKIEKGGKLTQQGKEIGQINPGYQAEVNGRIVDLAATNRVLLQFELNGDNRKHRILSLGQERITKDGRHIKGGLVHHDQLLREGLECRQKAREGDREYFAKKPYLNEMFRMDSFDKNLDKFSENIDTQLSNLNKQIDKIFSQGFDSSFENNKVDSTIELTQNLVSSLNFTSISSEETSREGLAAQRQANDAMVSGVITVVTGGLGSWASSALAFKRGADVINLSTVAGRTLLSQTMAVAGTGGIIAGGAISGYGRSSAESNNTANVISGSLEGLGSALGSVGGHWLNAYKSSEKIGHIGELIYRATESVGQAFLNTSAGAVREGDAKLLTVSGIVTNSLAQMGSSYAGIVLGKISARLSEAVSARMGNNLSEAAQALGLRDGQEILRGLNARSKEMIERLQQKGFTAEKLQRLNLEAIVLRGIDTVSDVTNDGLSGYANGFSTALPAALQAEKERIAAKYGIKPSEVDGDLLSENIDYAKIATHCHESGAEAFRSAAMTSAVMRPIQKIMERTYDEGGINSEDGANRSSRGEGDARIIGNETRLGNDITSEASNARIRTASDGSITATKGAELSINGESHPNVRLHIENGARVIAKDGSHGKLTGSGLLEVSGSKTKLEIEVPEGQTLRVVVREGMPDINVSAQSKGRIEVVMETGFELPPGLGKYKDAFPEDPRVHLLDRADLEREHPPTEFRALSIDEQRGRLQELEQRLRKQSESIPLEQWNKIFDGDHDFGDGVPRPLSPVERKIAMELMQQSSPNMNSRAVDTQMKDVAEHLKSRGVTEKDKVTVYVADNSSEGNALAHLYAKNSSNKIQVKVLDGEFFGELQQTVSKFKKLKAEFDCCEEALYSAKKAQDKDVELIKRLAVEVQEKKNKLKNESPELPPGLVLDDLSRFNPEQRQVIADLSKLQKDLLVVNNGFSRGMNMYDHAVTSITRDATSMKQKLTEMVKDAQSIMRDKGISEQEAARQYLEGEQYDVDQKAMFSTRGETAAKKRLVFESLDLSEAKRIEALHRDSSEPLATKEQLEKYLAAIEAKLHIVNERRKQSGLDEIRGSAEEFRTASLLMLERSAHFNDYSTIVRQMKKLDDSIGSHLRTQKLGRDDYLLVTGLEKDGSSYLATHLYAKANGIPSERVVSMEQLKALAKNPEKAKELLGNKRLVFLDDYKNSGRQQAELVSDAHRDTLSKITGPDGQPLIQDVIMANLAKHDLPAGAESSNPINFFGRDKLFHIEPGSTAKPPLDGMLKVHSIAAEHYVNIRDADVLHRRGLSSYKDLLDEMGLGSMYTSSSIASGVITPYGMPNNNPRFMALAEGPLNLPKRYADISLFVRAGERLPKPHTEMAKGVWNGSAPNDATALAKIIQESGADVLIDLRSTESRDAIKDQQNWIKNLSGKQPEARNIPIPNQLPKDGSPAYGKFLTQLNEFENVLAKTKSEGKTVFFCCDGGQDRTGMMRAFHEVLAEGKSIEQALSNWRQLKDGVIDESFLNLYNENQFRKIINDYRKQFDRS